MLKFTVSVLVWNSDLHQSNQSRGSVPWAFRVASYARKNVVAVPVWATILNKVTSGQTDGKRGKRWIWKYLCLVFAFHTSVRLVYPASSQKWLFKTFGFKNSMVCQLKSVPHVLCCWKHNFCAENKVWGCLCRSKLKRKSALWLDRMWNSVLLVVFPAGKCDNLTGSNIEKWNFPKWDQWSVSSFLSV